MMRENIASCYFAEGATTRMTPLEKKRKYSDKRSRTDATQKVGIPTYVARPLVGTNWPGCLAWPYRGGACTYRLC